MFPYLSSYYLYLYSLAYLSITLVLFNRKSRL